MDDNDKIDQHESYGCVGLNRVSGSTFLFGSDAEHHSFLRLEIRRASTRRSLNHDWLQAESLPLITIDLSHTKFAQLITSPGIGNGVECTIRAINGQQMAPPPPPERIISKFSADLKQTMAEAMSTLDSLRTQLAETLLPGNKALGKKELGVLLKGIDHAVMQVKSNLPYVEESFNESMEKKVDSAVTELEGVRDHMITQMGLRALAARAESELPEFTLKAKPQSQLSTPEESDDPNLPSEEEFKASERKL